MTSFNLIMPELNTFITLLDGAEYKGLIITIFTISAGLARPFSGKLSDTIGRKKVIFFGLVICFVTSLLYPLSYSIWFFLALRFIHGFSVGFSPTGATALITDILPEEKRGQGMGIWGTFISLGIGVGQSLGSLIGDTLGLTNLFFISASIAVLSGILMYYVEETLEKQEAFKPKLLLLKWQDVFEPSVLPAAMVMALSAVCSGIIFVVTPDMSEYLGITNKGWFFGIYVIATIVIRLFSSSLSDRIGRRQTLLIGFGFLTISMFLLGAADSIFSYGVAAIVFGVATGISSPTLFAWTADLSHPERRGVGSGTMFIALEIGIMTGSALTLFSYDNSIASVKTTFLIAAGFAITSMLYLTWHLFRRQKTS
ncbi:MAG: MFS transporter [Cryomorphaceae bacterium]|nr:MFS transporter [Cryomorphaceae bacterium]